MDLSFLLGDAKFYVVHFAALTAYVAAIAVVFSAGERVFAKVFKK